MSRQLVPDKVCPRPTLSAACSLYEHSRATTKGNASFSLTPVPGYLQDGLTRNMKSHMLCCYRKAKYVSSPQSHHSTFMLICCTLHLQCGNTVQGLAALRQSSAHCKHRPNVQRHKHTHTLKGAGHGTWRLTERKETQTPWPLARGLLSERTTGPALRCNAGQL